MEPHWIIGAAFFASGTFLAWSAVKQIYYGRRSMRWPTTTGIILRIRGQAGITVSRHTVKSWIPEYEYEVDGIVYRSTRYDFGGRNTASLTGAFPNMLVSGEPVRVYFDPGNPAESVLVAGAARGHYVVFGIGLFFVVKGLVLFLDALGVGTHR